MKFVHRFKTLFVLACCSGGLVACGGGGGGGPAPAGSDRIAPLTGSTVDLSDSAVAAQVVADAADNVNGIDNLTGNLSSYTGLLTGIQAQTTPRVSAASVGAVLAKKVLQSPAAGIAKGAQSQTESCDAGGTLEVTARQAQANSLHAGDSFTIVATNCVMNLNGTLVTMRGQMRMDVLAGSSMGATLVNMTLGLQMTPVMVTVGSDLVGMDGGFRLQFGGVEEDVTLSTLPELPYFTTRAVSGGQEQKSTFTNFSVSTYISLSGTATVSSAAHFASPVQYSWSTTQPLYTNPSGQFSSGQLVITSGPAAAALRLTFGQSCSNTTTCVLHESAPDASSYTAVKTYSWAEFSSL